MQLRGSQEKSLPSIISHPDEENRVSARPPAENAAENLQNESLSCWLIPKRSLEIER
jgi:hypothetical protein